MSCIITYKGQKYSEEQFKEYFINNKNEFVTSIARNKDVIDSFKRKMEGIDFVFSQSPELASIGSKAQYLQYLSTIFPVKAGVEELFESNPELANAVYEALGFNVIKESEITYTDEDGKPCAKMGGRSSKFTKGSQWEIVKDLKGYPSHSQGGVDVKIGKNGFNFTRDNGVIEAKYGLVLPKIK